MSKKLMQCKVCLNDMAKSARRCPSCGAKNKKPIYKRIWVWVLAIIVVIAVTSGNDSTTNEDSANGESSTSVSQESTTTNSETTSTEEVTTTTSYKAGTYKVGSEIAAGEYMFIASGSMGYIECTSDSTGSFDSIIYNDNVSGNSYLTVKDGEYIKISGGTMYPVSEAPSVVPADGLYEDGMYKVGTDIAAGEYKVTSTSSYGGYLEVTTDSRHDLYSIVTNEIIENDTYITIEDGQYITLSGAQIQQ